jgi:hypothetical protein
MSPVPADARETPAEVLDGGVVLRGVVVSRLVSWLAVTIRQSHL